MPSASRVFSILLRCIWHTNCRKCHNAVQAIMSIITMYIRAAFPFVASLRAAIAINIMEQSTPPRSGTRHSSGLLGSARAGLSSRTCLICFHYGGQGRCGTVGRLYTLTGCYNFLFYS